jgi:hypothetical protein
MLAVLGLAAPVRAQSSAVEAPLRGFTTAELNRITPLLDHGIVGLVELAQGDVVPAIHLAAHVEAPAEVVRDVLANPSAYPSFMPAVSEVVEHEAHESSVAFTWRWRTSIFTLGGDATLTRLDPSASERERGYRVMVERTRGDLGQGREVWRVLPQGPRRSLVLMSTRMDLRDANYLTRQMAHASLSMSRSINLSMGLGMLTRVRMEAERRAGYERPSVDAALARPPLDAVSLDPLLRRGDVVLVEVNGAELRQSSVVTRLPHPEQTVRDMMLDPVSFTQALINGSSAVVRERTDDGVRFDWAIDLPLIGTGGTMTLREAEDRVIHLDAIGGAMNGGAWRFATRPLPGGATAVTGWASFDVGSANFLLRAIVDADASLRPGLSAATEVMMARALRIRLER